MFRTAFSLREMEKRNRLLSKGIDLPTDASKLISKGQISVIGLGGYTPDIQAGIYSLVADKLFNGKVADSIKLPFVIILEEAHRFAPNRSEEDSQNQSMQLTRQIAQEGRKFGVGLILISQRPSRLDETALSQCNSFVIMRLINPADQKFVRTVIETVGEEEAKLLPDLDIGEALICGQCVQFPILVKIKSPDSRGEKQEKEARDGRAGKTRRCDALERPLQAPRDAEIPCLRLSRMAPGNVRPSLGFPELISASAE